MIDDDATTAVVTRSVMAPQQVSVRREARTNKALLAVKDESFDLVILSAEMAQSFATCNKQKSDEQTKSIPVVLISAQPDRLAFTVHQSMHTRADVYLAKPLDERRFGKILKKLADKVSTTDSSDEPAAAAKRPAASSDTALSSACCTARRVDSCCCARMTAWRSDEASVFPGAMARRGCRLAWRPGLLPPPAWSGWAGLGCRQHGGVGGGFPVAWTAASRWPGLLLPGGLERAGKVLEGRRRADGGAGGRRL